MNNLFIIIGRITKDLELRETKSGKKVLDINIAISNGQDDATFITATTFNQQAENTSKYCQKGDLIQASGTIKNHNWEDKEGKKHYDFQFYANSILFLETKKKKENVTHNNVKTEYDDEKSDIKIEDSDLPF